MSGSRLVLYAAAAPRWWPWQLVSLANGRLPERQRPGFYSVILDNGMYRFYRDGYRPPLERWLHRLRLLAADVERLRRPRELVVVLPDWLGDPGWTVRAAASPEARRLCRTYRCAAVAHSASGLGGYAAAAEQLASMDHVQLLMAPLKLNCTRLTPSGRRVLDKRGMRCQLEVARQVCGAARSHGLPCHGLGAPLKHEQLARLAALLDSADTSSWTRPVNAANPSAKRWSAKTAREREEYFRRMLEHLKDIIAAPSTLIA